MIAGTVKGVISQRLVPGADGGRVAVCEILRMTGRVRDMIVDPTQTGKLVEVITSGGYYGMQTFDQALFGHVKAGRVTFEDAMRVASSPHDFKLLMQADGRKGTTMEDVASAEEQRESDPKPSSLSRRLTLQLPGGSHGTSVGKVTVEMAVDETCPVCRTAEIVCGKWTLLLVRDLAEGRSRFCELERSLAGISPRTLSLRLRALEEQEIVERHTFPEVPPRVEYALTEKGRALLPIIDDMRAYGEDWLGAECAERMARRPSASMGARAACGRCAVRRCKRGCAEQERERRARSERTMRSRRLQTALTEFVDAAASHLQAEVDCGRGGPLRAGLRARRGDGAPRPLYCYRALTGAFIAERERELERLPGHAEAARLLEAFDGLDRYLASVGARATRARRDRHARARRDQGAAGGRVRRADRLRASAPSASAGGARAARAVRAARARTR